MYRPRLMNSICMAIPYQEYGQMYLPFAHNVVTMSRTDGHVCNLSSSNFIVTQRNLRRRS